jgi:HlyD family secretion protein
MRIIISPLGVSVARRPESFVVLVAAGLITLAAASGAAYWLLRPQPPPAQVIYGSGRIEADEVRVGFETPGRLLENDAVEGESLLAGQVLGRVDASDYELQAARAESQRVAAAEAASQVDTQIALASHHARTAQVDLGRFQSLAPDGAVSAQEVDLAQNNYMAAADQVRTLRQQRAEAQAQAQVAAQTVALARSQIGKTRIVSPISGVVLQRLVEPGEVLAPGEPIAVLADLSSVKLKVFITEQVLGKIRLGAQAHVRIDAFPGRDFPATVSQVDAQAQFTPRDVHVADERSRTVYGVTLRAPNPDGLLKAGMPADAWILWDPRAGWPARLQPPE